MITGQVNSDLEPVIGLTVLGLHGEAREIEAVIDTGFSGYLTPLGAGGMVRSIARATLASAVMVKVLPSSFSSRF